MERIIRRIRLYINRGEPKEFSFFDLFDLQFVLLFLLIITYIFLLFFNDEFRIYGILISFFLAMETMVITKAKKISFSHLLYKKVRKFKYRNIAFKRCYILLLIINTLFLILSAIMIFLYCYPIVLDV